MPAALLTVHLQLPACTSLKEKRSQIKPILARLHREYNVSTAELDLQDKWNEAFLGFMCLSSDQDNCRRVLQSVLTFIEKHFPDILIFYHRIEMIL
jgi:uncharacterized protein YlxP (DUF503 family)